MAPKKNFLKLRPYMVSFIEAAVAVRKARCENRRAVEDLEASSDFDSYGIRWMIEGRWGQEHPDSDWDHPAWADPRGLFAAYDDWDYSIRVDPPERPMADVGRERVEYGLHRARYAAYDGMGSLAADGA